MASKRVWFGKEAAKVYWEQKSTSWKKIDGLINKGIEERFSP